MKDDKTSMMDLAIVDELKAIIETSPYSHAMWIAGSIAEGYADELSDADLWVDIEDGKDKEVYELIEKFLATKGRIDINFTESLSPPFTHKVYRIADTNPYHFIEFTLHTHSDKFNPTAGGRKIKVLFDKNGILDNQASKDDSKEELQERKQFLIGKINIGYISVEKEIIRGQFMDAMHNYVFWLVEPVIELARIKYSPQKISFGLKHGSRDLPKEATDDIQSLYTIKSLSDFKNKIEEVKVMASRYS